MVMTEEKCVRFARLLARGGAAGKAGPSAPRTPPPCLRLQQPRRPPPPALQRMPLTPQLQSKPSLWPWLELPLPKPLWERTRRAPEVPLSSTSSCSRGGGGDFGEPALATAPELPGAVQHFLRGWRRAKAGNLIIEDAPIESVFCSLGSYFAQIHDHREQATKEKLAMVDEVAKPKKNRTNAKPW
ncbi:hypothetical protein ACSQ67_025529 [Phaseolus vulgaris]